VHHLNLTKYRVVVEYDRKVIAEVFVWVEPGQDWSLRYLLGTACWPGSFLVSVEEVK